MSAVVVGYVPGPEGRAALDRGHRSRRGCVKIRLVVVNTTRGDALVDERFLQGDAAETCAQSSTQLDIAAELQQGTDGSDVAEELDDGRRRGRRRADRDRAAPADAGRQADPGQRRQRILLSVTRPVLAVKA